jgi:hypothetical protein
MNLIDRAKSVGNAIVEFDAYQKLYQIDEIACKDHLRGYFGRQHGDWNKADVQADGAIHLLKSMGQREVGFKQALQAHQQLQKQQQEQQIIQAEVGPEGEVVFVFE